jgi:hypothetical protein
MRKSLREYVKAVFSQWVGVVGAVGFVLTLLDLYVGDVRVPPPLLWTLTGLSLAVAQFRAFHDVRFERDKALATRTISPEKTFELSDLIEELQDLANEHHDDPDYTSQLDGFRTRAYAWIDQEVPECSRAVRSKKGLSDLADIEDEDDAEAVRRIIRLEKIRKQLNDRLSSGR